MWSVLFSCHSKGLGVKEKGSDPEKGQSQIIPGTSDLIREKKSGDVYQILRTKFSTLRYASPDFHPQTFNDCVENAYQAAQTVMFT